VNTEIRRKLESAFSGLTVAVKEDSELVATTNKESVLSVLAYLKDAGYEHLALVSCVDWIEEGQFELVYILSSYTPNGKAYTGQEKLKLIVKARIPRDRPEFQTVTHIFANAEPYERELHELYGIRFEGHARLVPLFLERAYEIPPFRKDFDTREYVEKTFGAIPAVEDQEC